MSESVIENTQVKGFRADEKLTELIEKEQRNAFFYYMLAKKAPTPQSSKTLLLLAAEESNHAQGLLASYYLITGLKYIMNKKYNDMHIPFFQPALRAMFHNELKDASDYASLANLSNDASLKELFLRFADEEKQHAAWLRELLSGLM